MRWERWGCRHSLPVGLQPDESMKQKAPASSYWTPTPLPWGDGRPLLLFLLLLFLLFLFLLLLCWMRMGMRMVAVGAALLQWNSQ